MLDLGVTISASLCFNSHINKVIAKANRMLGMIKRVTDNEFGNLIRKDLYVSLVRCHLEYSSQTWSPYIKKNIEKIEGVQRRATKYILNDYTSTYKDRLLQCNLLPLSYRRECLDLQFLFKCLKDEIIVDVAQFTSVNPHPLRSVPHSVFDFKVPFCCTDSFKFFYFNRVVRLWNSLPYSIRTCNTVSTFKTHLKKMYHNKLCDVFMSDNTCTWAALCNCANCNYT